MRRLALDDGMAHVGGGVQTARMPELPEVQALADDLRGRLVGRRVRRLDTYAISALKTFDPPTRALDGGEITGVERHGKWLDLAVATVGDAPTTLHVCIHLARAGWLRWRDEAPKARPRMGRGPLAAQLMLDDDAGFDLTEAGTKKGLAIHVVREPNDVADIATLGPDPLADDFDEAAFGAVLDEAGRARIKGVLRSQRRIAGIGNAYSDEILHAARMSPFHPASMGADDRHRLYVALRETLQDAVAARAGVPASSLKSEKRSDMRAHGRTGEACPVCGDTIRQVEYVDSTFQYCPTCQTGGTPLSDRVLSRLLR